VTKTIGDNYRIYSLIIILNVGIIVSVRCEIFKMSKVNHLTTLLPLITSQFQMENANPLLEFMLQKLSNDILRANLDYIFVPKIYDSCSIITFKVVFI
jgi:hypothetical protein